MEASGLTLVLSYKGLKSTSSFLYQIIKDDQFSELHVNIFESTFLIEFLKSMNSKYLYKPETFKGYIYLYSCSFDPTSPEWFQMKNFRQISRTKVISFSVSPEIALKKVEFIKTNPFPYCKTGFDQEYLRIYLCYVPLFDVESTKVTTIDFSDFCLGFIKIDDFLFDNHKRTPIFILNDGIGEERKEKSVNFNDIHFLRADLFVENTLYLMPMDDPMHKNIQQIKEEVDKEFNENNSIEFKKEWNVNSIKNHIKNSKSFLNDIKNIICAYTYITRKNFNKTFSIRQTQIYAVLESYFSFYDEKKKNKGVVYQIKTGEGKSCIVSLIAAILAKKDKIVHIVSSNIKLSNRDYIDSFDFFNSLGIESTVLLHQNELPYYEKDPTFKVENEYLQAKEEGKYPDKFFSDDKFKNTSRMNFIACGLDNKLFKKKRRRVIFSTLVNFECFYLYLMENRPGFIDEYFKKAALLVDEADSILIDEIANGTIISREMKSNAKEILSFVYDSYQEKKSINDVFDELKDKPLCKEITIDIIKQMYKEIETVSNPEFSHGKKYSIETFTVKNSKRIKNFIKRTVKFIKYIREDLVDNLKKEIINDTKSLFLFNEDENDEINEEEEEEKEDLSLEKTKQFKQIIPFDYDHKGILKPNKEFSGFIPQFIALKEKKNHPDLIFKDISISYLYISHPIYAHYYKYICGFTGTIGKYEDRKIFLNRYNLLSKKINRHKPNLRVDFPITVCNDIKERNDIISEEVLYFHQKGNPVLVIFEDFNEIIDAVKALQDKFVQQYKDKYDQLLRDLHDEDKMETIYYQRFTSNERKKFLFLEKQDENLVSQKTGNKMGKVVNKYGKTITVDAIPINIFDGKDELIKPDLIAGIKGAISFGSNICGRGTDIKCSFEYPLHVIVTFYTNNERVLQQAFGRTARKDEFGSCHVICLKDHINKNYKLLNNNSVDKIISNANYKAEIQRKFIDYYQTNRDWLFGSVEKQSFNTIKNEENIQDIRKSKINVNRIVAYKYQFPICLSYETFLNIQSQKILSLFNCPNSIYTWRLVQRYLREMILESWSLMIKKVEQEYECNKNKQTYQELLDSEIKKLYKNLDKFIPKDKSSIVSIFTHICKRVIRKYESRIIKKDKVGLKQFEIFGSTLIQLGFKPYSLLSESGARILYTNLSEMNYIQDPELKYEKQQPNNKFTILSITEKIDDALNKLFQLINKFLGQKTFLKFFVRRTIAGCEFGICLDLFFVNKNPDVINDPFILIDKNPLLILTIFAWSMALLLVGILICLLIYIAKISGKISSYIACPAKFVTDAVGYVKEKAIELLKSASEKLQPNFIEIISEKINEFLKEVLKKQIKKYDKDSFIIVLAEMLDVIEFDGNDDKKGLKEIIIGKLNESIQSIKISPLFDDMIKECNIGPNVLKIGLLLILCVASFISNFKHFLSLVFFEKNAAEYDASFDPKDPNKAIEKLEELEENNSSEIKVYESKDIKDIEQTKNVDLFNLTINSPYFRFLKDINFVQSPFEISSYDIITSNAHQNSVIYLPSGKVYYRVKHELNDEFFDHIKRLSTINQIKENQEIKQKIAYKNQKVQQVNQAEIQPPIFLQPIINNCWFKPFFGFVINGDNSFSLYNVVPIKSCPLFDIKSLNVFAYGLACAMEYLHEHNIVYDLNQNNLFVFNDCIPFILYEQPVLNTEREALTQLECESGENDMKKKENVYSYGKILYYLVEKNGIEFKNSQIYSIQYIIDKQQQSNNNESPVNTSNTNAQYNNYGTRTTNSSNNNNRYSNYGTRTTNSSNNNAQSSNYGIRTTNSSNNNAQSKYYGTRTTNYPNAKKTYGNRYSAYKSSFRNNSSRSQYSTLKAQSVNQSLRKSLICNCMNDDPNLRPAFTDICDLLERVNNKDGYFREYIEKLKPFERKKQPSQRKSYNYY